MHHSLVCLRELGADDGGVGFNACSLIHVKLDYPHHPPSHLASQSPDMAPGSREYTLQSPERNWKLINDVRKLDII